MKSYYLMDAKIQFCKDEKNSRDGRMVVMVDQQYEYTEYCTLKMVKMVNFRFMLIQ